MTDEIERFDCRYDDSGMDAYSDGGFVLYADHIAAMHDKDAEIAELMKDVTFLQFGKDVIHDELRVEVERLTAENSNLKNWIDHHARDVPRLTSTLEMQERLWEKTVANLRGKLATSRAETAMAFEVAGDVAAVRCAACGVREIANLVKEHVKRSVPADATAALAARDKATREQALRDAAHVGYVACAETRHVTLGNDVSSAILSLIK